jgi:hypothetical protein
MEARETIVKRVVTYEQSAKFSLQGPSINMRIKIAKL